MHVHADAHARDAAVDAGPSGCAPRPPVVCCGAQSCRDVPSDPGAICPAVCCTPDGACGTHDAFTDRANARCAPPYVNTTRCPDTEYGLGCCVGDNICGLMRAYECWPRAAWVLSNAHCDGTSFTIDDAAHNAAGADAGR